MPKPTIDLQPYKGVITNWFHENVTTKDITKKLAINYNIVCTARTIRRRLNEWGATIRVRVKKTIVFCIKMANMFSTNFPDHIIVRSL
jgi:hypothetical protein